MWPKTLSTCKDPSDYAYCTCEVYSCGYSQPNRDYLTFDSLERGDAEADCSSAVNKWLMWGGFLDEYVGFHTAIEREYLKEHDFYMLEAGLFPAERNDVLWRSGHTGLYIGDGLQAELLRTEKHDAGYDGSIGGDQDGGESVVREYDPFSWDYILRYKGNSKQEDREVDEMTFIFSPNDDPKQPLMFYDGGFISPIENDDERIAIAEAYKKATGKDIPMFAIGTEDAPFGTRFMAVVQRKWHFGTMLDEIKNILVKVANRTGAW